MQIAKSCSGLGQKGGKDMIVIDNAYHGHLESCMAISPYKFNLMPSGQPDHVHVVSCPDSYRGMYRDSEYPESEISELYANQVRDTLAKGQAEGRRFAGFIAESIQSCGGQVLFPAGYLEKVYTHVHAAGGLCIADEVQVGFGRVGSHFWAFELQGPKAIPDIVTIGKPMGNGFPVAAVVTTPLIARQFSENTKVQYFNTYGGNPVSCAAALAVMDVIADENLQKHAAEIGEYLMSELRVLMREFDFIGSVRGTGLMLGVDIVTDRTSRNADRALANEIKRKMCIEESVIISTDGPYDNVLKIKPPMTFDVSDCDWLISSLRRVLKEVGQDRLI